MTNSQTDVTVVSESSERLNFKREIVYVHRDENLQAHHKTKDELNLNPSQCNIFQRYQIKW